MAPPSRTPSFWLAALLLGGGAALGASIYFSAKKKEEEGAEGMDSPETVEPMSQVVDTRPTPPPSGSQKLAPPLAPPLRKLTPNGWYGAPRPAGSTPEKATHFHQGIDLKGTAGEPILAVGDGKIIATRPGKGDIVRKLLLDDGRAIVYADLGTATVEPGTRVKTGDKIGTMRKNGFVHVAVRPSLSAPFINPKGHIPYAE